MEDNLNKFLVGKENEMEREIKRKHETGIRWGFKAPVSMLVTPFLHKMTGALKMLHVVRDGRDISFSGNQSPVNKFYRQTYGIDEGETDPYESKQ